MKELKWDYENWIQKKSREGVKRNQSEGRKAENKGAEIIQNISVITVNINGQSKQWKDKDCQTWKIIFSNTVCCSKGV